MINDFRFGNTEYWKALLKFVLVELDSNVTTLYTVYERVHILDLNNDFD